MQTSGVKPTTTPVVVREVVGKSGALAPENGGVLAAFVADAANNGHVTVDFSGCGALSSGFTNAFVLALQKSRPLEEWKQLLEFEGLDSVGHLVLARSLKAVRNLGR